MNKFLLTGFLLAVAFYCRAQRFSAATTDTLLFGNAAQADFYGHINLYNHAGQTLNMRWVRFEENLPQGWQTSVCDPQVCYGKTKDSANFNLPVTGNNNLINIHFYPNNVDGFGTSKIRVFEVSNPDSAIVLSFNGTTYAVGLEDREQISPVISFNPQNRLVIVEAAQFSSGETVIICNSLGQEIYAASLSGNYAEISMNGWPGGLYFVNLVSEKKTLSKKILLTVR